MDDVTLHDRISKAKADFGIKCGKYAGALTVELIKRALEERGITVSARDVFIKGIPIEIDLLIPKKDAIPEYGLLYQPEDVLAAIEIKNAGSFGDRTIATIKKNFLTINQHHAKIRCFYVTLTERKGFKWAISEQNIGYPAYTLFWHWGSGRNRKLESTGDWEKLINDTKAIQEERKSDPA